MGIAWSNRRPPARLPEMASQNETNYDDEVDTTPLRHDSLLGTIMMSPRSHRRRIVMPCPALSA